MGGKKRAPFVHLSCTFEAPKGSFRAPLGPLSCNPRCPPIYRPPISERPVPATVLAAGALEALRGAQRGGDTRVAGPKRGRRGGRQPLLVGKRTLQLLRLGQQVILPKGIRTELSLEGAKVGLELSPPYRVSAISFLLHG